MENVFLNGGLTNLSGWTVSKSRAFSEEELNAIASNEVVEQQYGKALQFYMKSGEVFRINLSRNSQGLSVGTQVDMKSAKLLTLTKTGSNPIIRVEV